jgi:hypothetical protein
MQRSVGIACVAALAIVKLVLVFVYGPLVQPDSAGYITFADTILTGTDWLHDRPGGGGEDSYRTIGYPALIAAAKLVAGPSWGYVVILVQAAASLAATVLVYGAAGTASGRVWLGLTVAAAFAGSGMLVYDLHILTDALYGSILAAAIALLVRSACFRPGGTGGAAVAGALLALAFLVRDFTLYLLPALAPLAILSVMRLSLAPVARAAGLALVFAPVVVLAAGYAGWNLYRSGEAYITTAGQTAALLPLVRAAERGVPVFDGETPLDRAAAARLSGQGYADVLAINRDLAVQGMSALEVNRMVRARYMAMLAAHPMEFAAMALRELRLERRVARLTNPLRSAYELDAFARGETVRNGSVRFAEARAAGSALPVIVVGAERAVTLVVTVAGALGVIGLPLALIAAPLTRGRFVPPDPLLASALWLVYMGSAATYALVSLEDRYLLGVVPWMVLVALLLARSLMRRRNTAS